ncbi:MAG: 2-oxoglutarate dehydrogenase E1 component, partial [Gammaproteobacteria bacterium]|nr:2-oxoglutarate dehydrogenase E1 component [Gammaproteobacteria bacterium]
MSDRDNNAHPSTEPDTYLNGANSAYLEQQYEQYLSNPNALDLQWRQHFDRLPKKDPRAPAEISEAEIRQQFYRFADSSQNAGSNCNISLAHERQQVRVLQLINAYRFFSHQAASCNPLGNAISANLSELTLAYHQLTKNDLDTVFQTGSWVGPVEATLQEILHALQRTYGSSIGFEYMHILETEDKRWLQHRIESVQAHPKVNHATRRWLLQRLTAAEGIERYLHAKYVGQKRFSLEGGESLIPMMSELIERAGSKGVEEIVIGMAHRGRLNMLINILGKTPAALFSEFEGQHTQRHSDGDVKYHQGFSSDMHTSGKNVHLVLAFNPSHLEIVAPMVEGSVRARQDRRNDPHGDTVLPISIHGDSAFAGQGVVMETLSLSQSRGFSTKGTIHIVINNQIGFTTSNVQDTRSTFYCTDIAKMINVPVFHVNGDDPEAVLFVTQLALDYRMAFKKDVIIDLVCYRRQGHNEADEPSATQPMMYQHIRSMPTTRALYAQKLAQEGVIQSGEAEQMIETYRAQLEQGGSVAPQQILDPAFMQQYGLDWRRFKGHKWNVHHDSRYDLAHLRELASQLHQLPQGFTLHPRVEKIRDDRRKMSAGALPIDWGYAETLAYATLLKQNYSIRLCGQDSGRGTFFHRHAVLHNQQDGESYVPLRNLKEVESNFLVIDSLLSEEAVLAFEYGYSATSPDHLVIWEAQFGDFANGAQVVI